MNELRCSKCKQLQLKYNIDKDKIIVEVKCYACNEFNYLVLQAITDKKGNLKIIQKENNEKDKK